jgi:hypothetical protein
VVIVEEAVVAEDEVIAEEAVALVIWTINSGLMKIKIEI